MNPLAALYGAAVGVRNELYDRGMLTLSHLEGPVVSIGNLTVGGSGKTPFLILLGELLKEHSIPFDVLSRGYRRLTTGVARVDPSGSPRECGDEPLLIARKLEVPVIVGEDRYAAGRLNEEHSGPRLHLLDDGFQHRRLARDFDIVLATSSDAQDSLLPTGRLREPLSSLKRADAVVLTNDMPRDGLRLGSQQVWRVTRDIIAPQTKEPCLAFCGIARPENFVAQLRAAGVMLAGTRIFRDHHRYSVEDIRQLLRLRKEHGAAAFVTTEKDVINLEGHLDALQPIHIVPVRMRLHNAPAVLKFILATVSERKRRPA
ncbi:MAG: tetraacyldisaccharide 4'-kinase [Candidatus Korobacteraceae bacterium]